jgi:ATP synthase protein I
MSDELQGTKDRPESGEADFVRQVELKAPRKLRMQRDKSQGVWFGLGMSGLIGWSVAAPTLLGAMLGLWWDRHHPGVHSWTLMLLVIGLVVGCANAWHWLSQQEAAMQEDGKEDIHE